MKKLFVQFLTLCLLACTITTMFTAVAHAIPTAEVSMEIKDVEVADDGFIFTLDITVAKPSEPYASLDFNLITSDYATLSIIDLNGDPEVTELDIDFAPGYGKAYHPGEEDSDTGGHRYMMGIFTQAANNGISDEMTICSVKMHYHGDATQTLRIRDMKLVYVNSAGGVASSPIISSNALASVDNDILRGMIETVPESSDQNSNIILVVLAVIVCAGAVFLFIRRRNAQ